MYNYQQSKMAKFFAVVFPIACLLAIFPVVVFSNLGVPDQPILYTTNKDGNFEIYKMAEDGNYQQRLTNTSGAESLPKWSPDGLKVLYTIDTGGVQQIWVMNADGSSPTLLSDPTIWSTQAQWFPGGQKILFVQSVAGGTDQLWTMNADGSNKTRLTTSDTYDHAARISPDGNRIVFGRCDGTYLACDVVVMNADGSGLVNLLPTNAAAGAMWTPDGSKIIYPALDGFNSPNVFIMNADGTNRIQLTMTASPRIIRPADVSPNGNQIALQSSAGNIAGTYEIYLVGVNGGGNITNITNNNAYDAAARWSYNGSSILFNSRRHDPLGDIYIMKANGNDVVRLTNSNGNSNGHIEIVGDWRRSLTTTAPRADFDFDGDGKADVAVFRPSNGYWYINHSLNNSLSAVQFGASGDLIAPADFDADGKTDVSVFRPSDGGWYRLNSSNDTFSALQFGTNGDLPVPGDFDSDGRADISVYRPSAGSWYRINSSNNQFIAAQFGVAEDKPLVGDFDGDARADLAVWRPSNGTWYRINSSNNQFAGVQFGTSEDKPVAADYDGDGKTDLAVYRPSNGYWYRINSGDNSLAATQFGIAEDKPAPADFDGDGKADLTVFRPSSGTWYLLRSTAGFTGQQFGASGDLPASNAFVRYSGGD
jgi:Tol biopolymer transport system component